ncbi:hypothetical protein BH11CYA1_BH11CYA1_49450 [soil metagenome]
MTESIKLDAPRVSSKDMTEQKTRDPQEVAAAYFRNFETGNKEDSWAVKYVQELVSDEPQDGWNMVLQLVKSAPSKDALAYVAEATLEDLLKNHGTELFDKVESESKANDRFRCTLSNVWLTDSDEIFPRYKALRKKYGFDKADPFDSLTDDMFR